MAEPHLENCLFSSARLPSELAHIRRVARKRGAFGAARFALSIASVYARQTRLLGADSHFTFAGETLPYFRHWRVTTFLNERTIEVPIVAREVVQSRSSAILEIGHVLGQYLDVPHTVVDKYERAPGVLNIDVVDFQPGAQYDLIVSISTLEHVGWDETPKEPDKVPRALTHLTSLLAPGGRLLCTMPLGYNPHLDERVAQRTLPLDDVRYLQRISAANEWREAAWEDVRGAAYGRPYPHANALMVGMIQR